LAGKKALAKKAEINFRLPNIGKPVALAVSVVVSSVSFNCRIPAEFVKFTLRGLLVVALPFSAAACVSANLSWVATVNPNVSGYDIYYGTASHGYTQSFDAGNTTNVTVSGLVANTTYFFAAKSHAANGNQSDFSNEAAFSSFFAKPEAILRLRTVTNTLTGNPLLYRLGAGAPAKASINPTNGIISWYPTRADAMTTNFFAVTVTDTVNPAWSLSESIMVVVSDYLEIRLGTAVVYAGQSGSVSLSAAASSSITNLQFMLNWPGGNLFSPTLTCLPPAVSGAIQNVGERLLLKLQIDPNQPLTSNAVAQLNFQAASPQPSAIFSIPMSAGSGTAANGVPYTNILTQAGEVVVVGSQPLLRPRSDPNGTRTLSLFANPGTYQLQHATSLMPPINWMPVVNYAQTNIAQSAPLDSAGMDFYRLQQL
jgi:hypothetical protein